MRTLTMLALGLSLLAPSVQTTPEPATATPTATATDASCAGREREPNDQPGGPTCVLVSGLAAAGRLDYAGDVDVFSLYVKAGRYYRITVDATATSALDPALWVSDEALTELGRNDDRGPLEVGAALTLKAEAAGEWRLLVTTDGPLGGEYVIRVEEVAATATPTFTPTLTPSATATIPPTATPAPTSSPAPTSTPAVGAQWEPNNGAAQAAALQLGVPVVEMVMPGDSDWWQLRVKPRVRYTCTVEVGRVAFDPALRIEQDGRTIAYNDDRAPGDPNAEVNWTAEADAIAFPVVETIFGAGDYKLVCSGEGEATPAPASGGGAGNAIPATSAATTASSPAAPTTAALTSTVLTPPAPTIVPVQIVRLADPLPPAAEVSVINVFVYYDSNNSGAPEPNEGVEGLSVRALIGGQFVGWALTDAGGRARIQVAGPVERVGIPYLGLYESVDAGTTTDIVWRIEPVRLPTFLNLVAPEDTP